MIRRFLALALLVPSLAWATCPTTDPYSTAVCALNPGNYWRMDALSGTSETDVGSSPSNGTYNGTFTLNQAGALTCGASCTDPAVHFAGTSGSFMDAGAIAAQPNLGSGVGWSHGLWMRADDLSSDYDVSGMSNSGNGNFTWVIVLNADGTFFWRLTTSTCAGAAYKDLTGSTHSANTYYFVVVTTVGGGAGTLTSAKLYVNASLIASASSFSGTACNTSTNPTFGGRRAGTVQPFPGRIDEPFFLGSELSQAQVTALYNAATVVPGLPNMGHRIYESRRTWFPESSLPPIFGVKAPAPFKLGDPTFVVEALNKLGMRAPGPYGE